MNNNGFLWIIGGIYIIIFLLVIRYKKKSKQEALQEKEFNENMITRDRYFIRNKYDPISLSRSMFQKDIYDKDVKESETNFLSGMEQSKNNNEILKLLKKRLLEVLKLRELYETSLASSKNEQYRESSVMGFSIDKLKKYAQEKELINYCALLLDAFDKDREYNYGLREEKIYKTRYIYGSVQAIVEYEIKKIETFKSGFLSKVHIRKEQIEEGFHKQYKQESQEQKKVNS